MLAMWFHPECGLSITYVTSIPKYNILEEDMCIEQCFRDIGHITWVCHTIKMYSKVIYIGQSKGYIVNSPGTHCVIPSLCLFILIYFFNI